MTIIKGVLKEKVLECIKQNRSLNQISKELKLNKTTVYYWYRKLGKSKLIKINVKNVGNNELTGEFIGIFAGDGDYYLSKEYHHNITVSIDSRDKKYINHVKLLITELFSKKPYVFERKDQNESIVRMRSKDIYLIIRNYLIWNGRKSHSVHLKDGIKTYSNEFLKAFVRGLFDTDGFINRSKPRVVFGTVSKLLSNNVEEILSLMKISYIKNTIIDKRGNRKPLNLIEISRSHTDKFFELIKTIH
jgi:intein/homing endonuclease